MAQDYYDEPEPDDQQDAVKAPDTAAPEESDEGEEPMDTQTALLPKNFFAREPAVGETCEVKVEKVLPDEIQVSYVPHDRSNEPETPMPQAAPTEPQPAGGMYD